MFNKETDSNELKEQFEAANRRRDELQALLPELRAAVDRAAAKVQHAKESLERAQGDFLIGQIEEAQLHAEQKHLEAALNADRRARAELRKAETDIEHSHQAISRLAAKVYAARIDYHGKRQKQKVRELLPELAKVEALMRELHAIYLEAEREFPFHHAGARRSPRPYPVAAGLTDLSWPEFTRQPGTGGRLEDWRSRVEQLLNPTEPVPVGGKKWRDILDPPASATRRDRNNRWQPVPAEEHR